jgi:hypothetical protein
LRLLYKADMHTPPINASTTYHTTLTLFFSLSICVGIISSGKPHKPLQILTKESTTGAFFHIGLLSPNDIVETVIKP